MKNLKMSLAKLFFRRLSTVFALSSGFGKCGVAVVRISGSNVGVIYQKMIKPFSTPQARKATLRYIVNPVDGEVLDRGLVLWFPGPYSFTGEDCLELHIHGGNAVISSVLNALSTLPNFVHAEPGDFTKRAFYNGKLDLVSAEGLSDLINAETEAQRKQAFRQLEGSLSDKYSNWKQSLLNCRALLEAYVDFSEEENIEDTVLNNVQNNILTLMQEIAVHLNDKRCGERLRNGVNLAILGKPNVGKSSFLNLLLGRKAAIVSHIPGTTRDVIESTFELSGYPVIVSDTAGLRKTNDIIEEEGVRCALEKSKNADAAIIIIDAAEVMPYMYSDNFTCYDFFSDYLRELRVHSDLENESNEWISEKNYLILINKSDLLSHSEVNHIKQLLSDNCKVISLLTEDGVCDALNSLSLICKKICSLGHSENPIITSQRHRAHLSNCMAELKAIFPDGMPSILQSDESILLAALHLQIASRYLGHIIGHISAEDVLDKIFSSFCIGK